MSFEMRIYWWLGLHRMLCAVHLTACHNFFAPRCPWHLLWVQKFTKRPRMTSPKSGNLF